MRFLVTPILSLTPFTGELSDETLFLRRLLVGLRSSVGKAFSPIDRSKRINTKYADGDTHAYGFYSVDGFACVSKSICKADGTHTKIKKTVASAH